MDIEPFDEKGHTTVLNDDEAEEGLGYAIEPRRVSHHPPATERKLTQIATPSETVKADSGDLDQYTGIRGWYRSTISMDLFWSCVLCGQGEQAHDDGSYVQWDV